MSSCSRSLRSPIDVAIRAFAISRKQRFELELRSVPESVDVVVLSGPIDNREVTDFSDPQMLIEQSYQLAERSLDDAELARRKRLNLRRPWWRRYAVLPLARDLLARCERGLPVAPRRSARLASSRRCRSPRRPASTR